MISSKTVYLMRHKQTPHISYQREFHVLLQERNVPIQKNKSRKKVIKKKLILAMALWGHLEVGKKMGLEAVALLYVCLGKIYASGWSLRLHSTRF